jgi:(p)ppGpp synthase/HD superfamily hydrolase
MQLTWIPDEYIHTYIFAAQAHFGQLMPDTELPYIVHVTLVSMEILAALQVEPGYDGDLAIKCALLHDVLEDTKITSTQITNKFGERIAYGVSALTKDCRLEKTRQMEDSLRRIQKQPREVWMVKMADRIINLRPPPSSWSKDKIQDYKQDSIKIHAALNSASQYLATRLYAKIKDYGIG